MDNRQWILFMLDAIVERAEIRDLSDSAIFFATMKQGKAHSEAPHSSRIPISTCVGLLFRMFVHGLKGPDMHGGAPVLSQVLNQCGLFGGGTHQETHQTFFCSWPGGVVTCGVDQDLNVFGWQ